MGLFNNEMVIDKEKPFEKDKLDRKYEIEKLTSIFEVVDNELVLAINSPWGTGKTTFLKMWEAYLNNKGYKTIYFNCWQNDFVEEPFIAFIEEIKSKLSTKENKKFIESAKDVSRLLIKQVPSIAKKFIQDKSGVDLSLVNEDMLSDFVLEKMDQYSKSKDTIKNFKRQLEQLANENIEDTKKPLVIFVDELDRCRPDFAISLLERIKHFFNISNIIFILGIDKRALSNSIKVVYGDNTNINGYLSRFIDMEYTIKEDNSSKYIEFLLKKYSFNEIYKKIDKDGSIIDVFKNVIELFEIFQMPLRELEKIIANLSLIIKYSKNDKNIVDGYLLIFLFILKNVNKNLFKKIEDSHIKCNELIEELNKIFSFSNWKDDVDGNGIIIFVYLTIILRDKDYVKFIKKKSEEAEEESWDDVNVRFLELYDDLKQDIRGDQRKIFFDTINMYDGLEISISDK